MTPPVLSMKSQARPSGCSPEASARKQPMSTNGPNLRSTSVLTWRMRGVMLSPMTGDSGWNLAIRASTFRRWAVSAVTCRRSSAILAWAAC